jgi:NADP-dependent 3-hydroxy acid dehydrogenase YdfG
MSIPKFEGQVALVTGATRGIGAAIALELAQRGLKVVGTGTTDEGAAKITSALSAYDGRGRALDVNDGAAVEALVDEIVKAYGAIHVLVNNAGITRDTLAMRMKDSDWDAVLDTNLKAVFSLSRAVIRPMMKQRYGRIISITSVVGASGNAGQANYAAAKAGDPRPGPRTRQPQHHSQLRRTRFHRDRHDGQPARSPATGAAAADPPGPPGQARRHRACSGLSRIAPGVLRHGAGAARQRRHAHVAARRNLFPYRVRGKCHNAPG